MMREQLWRAGCSVALLSLLAGCGNGDLEDLKQWMAQTKSQTPIVTPKLNEPKRFEPFSYDQGASIDPFNPSKLLVALSRDRLKNNGLHPDLDRRREVLENYPLDTIKMVGTIQRNGTTIALLKADKTVFQAKVGNYIGQNFGQIKAITETEVDLKELVQDASGEWVERDATLALQESQK